MHWSQSRSRSSVTIGVFPDAVRLTRSQVARLLGRQSVDPGLQVVADRIDKVTPKERLIIRDQERVEMVTPERQAQPVEFEVIDLHECQRRRRVTQRS